MGKLKATLEEVRAQKAQLEGQLMVAETKVADLRERLEQKEVGNGGLAAMVWRPQGDAAQLDVLAVCWPWR